MGLVDLFALAAFRADIEMADQIIGAQRLPVPTPGAFVFDTELFNDQLRILKRSIFAHYFEGLLNGALGEGAAPAEADLFDSGHPAALDFLQELLDQLLNYRIFMHATIPLPINPTEVQSFRAAGQELFWGKSRVTPILE
jgi:hypothetical protein